MPRAARVAPGGMIFHVLNCGNDQRTIFGNEDDYAAFLRLFGQTQEAAPMRVLAYCLLSNHWHLRASRPVAVVQPDAAARAAASGGDRAVVRLADAASEELGRSGERSADGRRVGRLAQVGSTRLPVRRRGLATEHRQATRLGVHAAPPRATAKETMSVPGNQRNGTYPLFRFGLSARPQTVVLKHNGLADLELGRIDFGETREVMAFWER